MGNQAARELLLSGKAPHTPGCSICCLAPRGLGQEGSWGKGFLPILEALPQLQQQRKWVYFLVVIPSMGQGQEGTFLAAPLSPKRGHQRKASCRVCSPVSSFGASLSIGYWRWCFGIQQEWQQQGWWLEAGTEVSSVPLRLFGCSWGGGGHQLSAPESSSLKGCCPGCN